jgi:hypothetical protein
MKAYGVLFFLIHPSDKTAKGINMSEEKNKNVVRLYIEEAINYGNLELIDTSFAPVMRVRVRGYLTGGDMVMVRWLRYLGTGCSSSTKFAIVER